LLNIAAQRNFQAAVDVEVTGPFFPDAASVQQALATLMATHVKHPAYLRYRGKPVIFFWRQQRFDAATWAAIRQTVDPDHTAWWIAEGLDLSYLETFDGLHLYSIAWANNPAAELSKWPPRIQKVEDRLGAEKLWVATAMPGYNDLNLNRADSFVRARNNGNFYRQTWRAAQATEPDMLIITSFNEWLEGTQIEAGATYGNLYLDLTRQLMNEGNAAPPDVTLATPVPAQTKTASNAPPSASVAAAKRNLSAGNLYTIQPGDTLYAIAFAFDVPLEALLRTNNITANGILLVGQALFIPTLKGNSPPRKIFPLRQEHNIPP
jgi:LysM repeat protein